jgi:hypothetical protein
VSHVSFSAATGSHVNLGASGGERMSRAGQPHPWWRALWSRRDGRVGEIRRLMQAQVEVLADAPRHAALAAQIRDADDPEALWSLRDALTQALIEAHGEAIARRRMTDITFMFAGLLDRKRHVRAAFTGPGYEADWSANSRVRGLVRSAEQALSDH